MSPGKRSTPREREGQGARDQVEALVRFRQICLALPESTESGSWGHPNFRAGKRTFAAWEWIKGRPSFAFRLGSDEAAAFLLQHGDSFATPYGRGQWVSVWADEEADWPLLSELAERAYLSVALKRMVAALEARRTNE